MEGQSAFMGVEAAKRSIALEELAWVGGNSALKGDSGLEGRVRKLK